MNIKKTVLNSPMALVNKLVNRRANQKVMHLEFGNVPGEKSPKPNFETQGVSGVKLWGETFNEEYVSDLKGYLAQQQYSKMLRGDYKVAFLENAIMATIKSADFQFSEPKVPRGKDIKDACTWQLKEGFNKTHSENLNDIASYKFRGFSIFEPTLWEHYEHDTYGDIWRLKTLGFRAQESIKGWKLDELTEELVWVKQQPEYTESLSTRYIDGKNIIIFNEKRIGANYEGIPILRPAYGPWYRKNVYYKLLAIGLEKGSMGILLVTVPPGKVGSDEEDAFLDAIKNYIVHENAYIKKTGYPAGSGGNMKEKFAGFDVEVITVDFKAESIIEAIRLEDSAIAACGNAMFGELAQGKKGGGYSLGAAEIDFFFSSIVHDINYICEKLQPLYKAFTIYNFGRQKEYARLEATLDEHMGAEFGQILNYLNAIGAYTAQPEDEKWLRKKYKLPDLNKDILKKKIQEVKEYGKEEPKEEDDEDKETENNKMALATQDYIKYALRGINFKALKKERKEQIEKYNKKIKSMTLTIKDKLINDIENAINRNPKNPAKAISGIEVGFGRQLYNAIKDELTDAFALGKKQGSRILEAKRKKLSEINDFEVANRNWIKNTASVSAVIITDTIKKNAMLEATKGINQGLGVKEIIFNTNNKLDDWINDNRNLGGDLLVTEALAEGRLEKYRDEGIEQTGRIYYNDIPVTEICKWLTGRTVKEGDPNIKKRTEPNHWGCDGYSVPIMSDEKQPDKWDGWNVPQYILDAQQTLSCDCNYIPEHINGLLTYFKEAKKK